MTEPEAEKRKLGEREPDIAGMSKVVKALKERT